MAHIIYNYVFHSYSTLKHSDGQRGHLHIGPGLHSQYN